MEVHLHPVDWRRGDRASQVDSLYWAVRMREGAAVHWGVMEGRNFTVVCGRWLGRASVEVRPAYIADKPSIVTCRSCSR